MYKLSKKFLATCKLVKIGLKKESSDYNNKVRYILRDCKISHSTVQISCYNKTLAWLDLQPFKTYWLCSGNQNSLLYFIWFLQILYQNKRDFSALPDALWFAIYWVVSEISWLLQVARNFLKFICEIIIIHVWILCSATHWCTCF